MGSGSAHGTWFSDDDVVIWTAFKGTHRKPRGKSLEKKLSKKKHRKYIEKNGKKIEKSEKF